eukprot:2011408-Amphidinium_carterae.1
MTRLFVRPTNCGSRTTRNSTNRMLQQHVTVHALGCSQPAKDDINTGGIEKYKAHCSNIVCLVLLKREPCRVLSQDGLALGLNRSVVLMEDPSPGSTVRRT